MSLSIIIPSRSIENLIPCVAAVRQHEPDARIIVVDDGLNWVSVPSCREFALFRALRGVKPFIYARNCNLGIIAAGTDDVLLLNDDALLQTPGGFTAMQQLLHTSPNFGLIAATCNNVGNLNQHPRGAGLREDPRAVCFIAVLIPRRTIGLVGLLDEEFTGYGYDDDSYCVRVRRAGLKLGIFDGCYVDHASLSSTFRGAGYPHQGFQHNQQVFLQKWGSLTA